jgi:hypothetical protein
MISAPSYCAPFDKVSLERVDYFQGADLEARTVPLNLRLFEATNRGKWQLDGELRKNFRTNQGGLLSWFFD